MENIIKEILTIKGMSCSHCVKTVEEELNKIDLISFKVSVGSAVVEYDTNFIDNKIINDAINKAGYSLAS